MDMVCKLGHDQGVMNRRALFLFCLLCVCALLGMTRTARHPFHVTIAQAEVAIDEEGLKVLQVALRVDPGDLDKALAIRAERRINIETTEEVDTLIIAYLDDVFLVRHPAQKVSEDPEPLEPCPAPAADDADASKKPATRPEEMNDKPKSIIRWVGMEIDLRYAWLYFEICIPDGIMGLEFSNRIFFELEPDQANTINFTHGTWKTSLSFTRLQAWRMLRKNADKDS